MDQLLQLVEKAAEVETVADGVVDLHRQRDTADTTTLIILAEGKDGQEIIIALLQIQVEAVKRGPWDHGNRKGVGRGAWFGLHLPPLAIQRPIFHIPLQENAVIRRKLRPEIGKGLCLRMENGITGMEL